MSDTPLTDDEYEVDLVPTFQMLCDFMEMWNDSCADEDRGRCESRLGLILHENGSGEIGTWNLGDTRYYFHKQFEFKTLGELADYIIEWLE